LSGEGWLKLDFDRHVLVHAPVSDRLLAMINELVRELKTGRRHYRRRGPRPKVRGGGKPGSEARDTLWHTGFVCEFNYDIHTPRAPLHCMRAAPRVVSNKP
jgi:hypothetical protein